MTGQADESENAEQSNRAWWKGAVVYQIYPRSFLDTNKDGIGDLKGIAAKIPYIASLGVDAVWISPFFKSPMKDYGYDVSDYCDVDPMFGTLSDFKNLLAAAHKAGLKIIIDMVLSHTSDRHPWFNESRTSRNNPKADWYVWADPKPDGSPPTNWQSVFGGSSWQYDVSRGQYYLHNFLTEQPDLNLHNADVRAALLDAMKFWLDMGVDGIRLDAAAHYFHKMPLRDNPPNPNPAPSQFNIAFPTPFTMQKHENDIDIAPSLAFAAEIRALLDRYPDRMAVAEIGGDDGVRLSAEYTSGPKRLHTAYNFSLISGETLSAAKIRGAVEDFAAQPGGAWPSWAFSNHDVVRAASRWHPDKKGYNHDPRLSRLLVALLASLRGTVFLYQGEELGLPEAAVAYDDIQDPWGRYLYPLWQGRDGCRTPMPWNKDAKGGFTKGRPWLPVPETHRTLSVAAQEKDKKSLLHFTRGFLEWRKTRPDLIGGAIAFKDMGDDSILAFRRGPEETGMLCLFNLSATPRTVTMGRNSFSLAPYGFLHTEVA